MPHVDFWFDFISPYAYFAFLRIRELTEARGASLRLRPVLFAGLLDHHGQLGPAEIPSKRAHTFRDVARYAAKHDVELVGPPAHPFNPLTALRCSLPQVAGAHQATVIEALYLGSWGRGADLGDPAAIAALLRGAGLDGDALVARAADREVKDALKQEVAAAIERGVFGVPTCDCDGELFWGNDRLEDVALRLEGRDPLPEGAAARLLGIPAASIRPGSRRR